MLVRLLRGGAGHQACRGLGDKRPAISVVAAPIHTSFQKTDGQDGRAANLRDLKHQSLGGGGKWPLECRGERRLRVPDVHDGN